MEKEQLEKLGIFELRDFARKIGVFNPTVLKKNDLISAIQDVQSGKTKPHISKTRQGRPPKEIGRLVNIFVPDNVLNIPTMQEKRYEHKEPSYKFYCNMEKPEGVDPILYKGYFELLETSEGLLRKKINSSELENERCFVRFSTINRYNIKEGDEIVCYAYFISEDRPLLCDEVISINNVAVLDMNSRLDFEELPVCNHTKKVKISDKDFNGIELNYGDTIFCHIDNLDDFINFSVKFANTNKLLYDKFIFVSPASRVERYDLLKSFPDELYISSFLSNLSNQKRTAFMALNRAKRLAEMGKNVCLFISDILEIVTFDSNNPYGELQISKDILSCAKNLENGSLTIMCGFKNSGLSLLQHKIDTTFALLETCGLKITNKGIDLNNSYRC